MNFLVDAGNAMGAVMLMVDKQGVDGVKKVHNGARVPVIELAISTVYSSMGTSCGKAKVAWERVKLVPANWMVCLVTAPVKNNWGIGGGAKE